MWPSDVYVMNPKGLSPKSLCTALLSVSSSTHDTRRQVPTTESAACPFVMTQLTATARMANASFASALIERVLLFDGITSVLRGALRRRGASFRRTITETYRPSNQSRGCNRQRALNLGCLELMDSGLVVLTSSFVEINLERTSCHGAKAG